MKTIKLKSARFENFKKLNTEIQFGENLTQISAANAVGKSSIADGIFWVLFGKSSTGKSEGKEFRPRPYDGTGTDIDHINVVVELTLEVNGAEVVLKKTQRQNWVRKRGTTSEVHEGDRNIYSWNNVEISETEFKNRISDIISEKDFLMITDPTAFFRLTKTEKINLILSLVAGITEEEILEQTGGFDELLELIRSGKSLDEIRATAKKSVAEMEKERDRITASINERSRDVIDMDVSDLELHRNSIKEELEKIDQKMSDMTEMISEYDAKANHIMELKFKQSTIERTANETLVKQKLDIQKRIDTAEDDFRKAMRTQKDAEMEIEQIKAAIGNAEKEKPILIEKFNAEKEKAFREYKPLPMLSDTDFICPTCGQIITEEQQKERILKHDLDEKQNRERYEDEKSEFELAKETTINTIIAAGKQIDNRIKNLHNDLDGDVRKLWAVKSDKIDANKRKTDAMNELAALPEKADLSENQIYEKLVLEIQKCEEALKSVNTGADYRNQLRGERCKWENDLEEVNRKFSAYDRSVDAKDRIMDLEQEFKEKVQMIADQERVLMAAEEFQTVKDNYLTEEVNKHFQTVRFQLFRKQKNGGVERVCDVYNAKGSPYGDCTTSGAEKLIMGLEIINVLSNIVGVKAFVIIDNAEKVSEGNMPKLDTQMIALAVSNDTEFHIERS